MFFATGAGTRVSEILIIVRFGHFLDKGIPFQFVFEGGDKETAFIVPVTLAFVVGVPGGNSFGLLVAVFFEEGVVLNVGPIVLLTHLEVEEIFSFGKMHSHGFGPHVLGVLPLFFGTDLPVFGNGPIFSMVLAGHVHLDAIQLVT